MGELESLIAVVERLRERVSELEDTIIDLYDKLQNHSHGYVPPPRYGGR